MAEQGVSNSLDAFSRHLAAAVERVGPAVVAVDARPRVRTSGVVWRAGVVVSTNHTVRRDEEITVTLHDGRELKATLAGRDPGTDLAVLRYDSGEPLGESIVAERGDAASLKVGHLVLAVGRAHPARGVSAGLGIVGAVAGGWRTWRGSEIDRLIRPDVSIFIGFSGGAPALVVIGDEEGEWVRDAVRAGVVRALLPRGASGGEIVAAVEAVSAGLFAFGADAFAALLSATPRTADGAAAGQTSEAGPPPAGTELDALTLREREVLDMLAEGLSNKEIAWRMKISGHTVKSHVASIFAKLNVSTRTEAVTQGIRRGLIMM